MPERAIQKVAPDVASRSITLTEFDEEAMMDVIDGTTFRHRLLGEPLRRFTHRRIVLPRCILDSGSYAAPMMIDGAFNDRVLTFGMTIGGPAEPQLYGRQMRPGDLQMYGEAAELLYTGPADTRWATCEVPRDALQQVARTLLGREINLPRSRQFINVPSRNGTSHAVMRIFRHMIFVEEHALQAVGRRVEDEVLSTLVRYIAGPDHHDPPVLVQPTTLAEAHDLRLLVERQLHEPYSSLEMCAHTGLTERTIERRFREVFHMSPRRWHLIERLHRARRELADPGADSVTGVAMRWGFYHLGRFSREYANLFGELPSETIRAA